MEYKVLTYERVSTEEQARTKSCDDQKSVNDRYISEKRWVCVGDYRDEGVSGTKTERKALKEMIDRCTEDHTIKGVVITEADRLARGISTYITIRDVLKTTGVKIYAVTQPMIDDTDEGETYGELLGVINGLLPKMTRRKSMRALDEKALRGWYPSKAPIGYKNVNRGTEDRPDRIIELDEQTSPYIKKIPELYNQGYSYKQIAQYLSDLGLKGYQQGKISANQIRQIIFNDIYLGEFDWRGKRFKGKHPSLFNRLEVEMARSRSKEKGHLHPTETLQNMFPYKKLNFFCKDCGCRITAHKRVKIYKRTGRTAEYIFYHCTKSKGGWQACRQPTINESAIVEAFIEKAIAPIEISREIADFFFEQLNTDAYERELEDEKLQTSISMRLGQIETELHRLLDMHLAGTLPQFAGKTSDEVYTEIRHKKELEKEDLLKNRDGLLKDTSVWKEKASNFFLLCIDAQKQFTDSSDEQKARFLKEVTSNVFLNNKTLEITHRFPFSEMLKIDRRTGVLRD